MSTESVNKLKEEICDVMKNIFQRGYVSALGGNVSARIPGSSEFWITPSGVFKGGLRPEDLVKVDLNGKVLEGSRRPSSEWRAHAAVYKIRPDVNAIVHAHNPITMGLIAAGYELKPVLSEAVIVLRRIEIVPFAFPGTEELARLVAEKAASGANALILKNHGILALGSNLREAEAIAETIEEVAIAQFISLALGKEPLAISEEDIKRHLNHRT